MIIDNKVMCVPQKTQIALLDKIAPMAALERKDEESSPIKGSSDVEVVDNDDDEQEEIITSISDEVESKTATKLPLEPLFPEKTLPISPPSSRKSKKIVVKKSVRFDQAVTARPCLHRKDYTSREAAASWYGRREFEKIRRELLKTLSLMYAGKFVECDESEAFSADESSSSLATASTNGSMTQPLNQQQHVSSSRGLEGFTVKGSLRSSIRKLRQKAITEVLVEQDFQVDRAESMKLTYLFYDDNAIRDVYQKHSKIAADTARNRGIEDHLVAIGAPKQTISTTPNKSSRRQSLRKIFFKSPSSDKPVRQPRRWSSSEVSMAEAAAIVRKSERPKRLSWTSSEKKIGKKQLWSLLTPKATKPNNPTAMVA